MSSPKPETKMSVEQQVKAGLRAVKDFLSGRSGDASVAETDDKATRDVVAAELLAKMSVGAIEEPARSQPEGVYSGNTLEIPRLDEGETREESFQPSSEEKQEQERAREMFLDHGYFDDAVQTLRTAHSPAERAAAARALGLVGSQRGTTHLIAAMLDKDPEVRAAAEQALGEVNDSIASDLVHPTLSSEVRELPEAQPKTSGMPQSSGSEATSEAAENVFATLPAAQVDRPLPPTVSESVTPGGAALDLAATTSSPTLEEEQLLLEEHRLRESSEQLTLQLFETSAARKQAEQEAQSRAEQEASLRAEAAARRIEEEKLRRRAQEEAERLSIEFRRALTTEQAARARAESEAHRLAEVETGLRLQAIELRLGIAELARRRVASETARRESAEAARQAEANHAHDEAKMRQDSELARLRREEEALRTSTNNIALRRAEVEAEREKADAEAERLLDARTRMRALAEAGAQAELERARLEAEIKQRTETALRLLEETKRHAKEEQERLQEEHRREVEDQRQRLVEFELIKTRAEAESRQLAEKEQQILSQVNSLQFADSQTRKRIEDAEVRRHASEDSYRLAAEKVQRVEAEAHARAKEEEQMLAKLESERRRVAVDAQSRAAQERRIREEIEMFRRLEEQERPQLEAAILQRQQAEARLMQLRDPLRGGAGAGVSGQKEMNVPGHYGVIAPEQGNEVDRYSAKVTAVGAEHRGVAGDERRVDGIDSVNVPPSILTYLNSVDPYKRAAAVAELARSRAQNTFSLISNCFDDPSPHVRNAAARAVHKLDPNRSIELFNRALEEGTEERRRNIGTAIAASGLASEAINNLAGENTEETYNSLSLLFAMAKTGEVAPLVRALEEHPEDEIGKAVTRVLSLSGHA